MTDEHSDGPPPLSEQVASADQTKPPVNRSARLENRIEVAMVLGYLLAAISVIVGIARIAKRREAGCPDGKTWPTGEQDLTCYVHPYAFEGGALIVVALMLAILIGLVAFLARAVVARDRQ